MRPTAAPGLVVWMTPRRRFHRLRLAARLRLMAAQAVAALIQFGALFFQ